MTERLNVRRMQTPDREMVPLHFDAEKEFTGSERALILGELNKVDAGTDVGKLTACAKDMKILFPKQAPKLSKEQTDALTIRLMRDATQKKWLPCVHMAACAKVLQPDLHIPIRWSQYQDIRKWVMDQVERAPTRVTSFSHGPFTSLADLKILFPDADRNAPSQEIIDFLRALLGKFRQDGRWHDFAAVAANMKIFAPKDVPEILDSDWDSMHFHLRQSKSERVGFLHQVQWLSAVGFAARMTLLDSEEVSVDKDGLHITRRLQNKNIAENTPPQPASLELGNDI